jgi:hypothetical protein
MRTRLLTRRRAGITGTALLGLLAALAYPVADAASPPRPEINFAATLIPRPCVDDGADAAESRMYAEEGWAGPNYERYAGACQRLRFAFGPILVKPGQNDVLIEPVTIEKPAQDGYITRFAPDLVRADGSVPPIEQVHLHHGTWLNLGESYGSGPFFAAGEEKTIASFPKGYGLPVKATDLWGLLYMVHSAVAQPMEVFITYEIDFVPQAAGDQLGLRAAYPVWLDVQPNSGYPVFNAQRGYGVGGRCTWPREECASVDPFGKITGGQGAPPDRAGGEVRLPDAGVAFGRIESFQGGTLIGIGSHLHPGGLEAEVDLVRGGEAQRIYTGEAKYWSRTDPTQTGGPPTSWDFSMTATGMPRWAVRVEPGDTLRINATYDTAIQSTYENMGIAIALLAPDLPDGTPAAPGIDPFAAPFDASAACDSGGIRAPTPTLCDKGIVTHGHLVENDNFGGPSGTWTATRGRPTSRVEMAAFLYAPGDLSMISMTGVPTVPLGSKLKFTNEDAAIDVYHTATSCGFPCLGPTGTAFPLSDGTTSTGRSLDFDSAELGIGIPYISAAKNEITWDLDVSAEAGYQAGEIVTYFCRIHPFMRGAFEVTEG